MSDNIKRQLQKQKFTKETKTIIEGFLKGIYFALESLGGLNANRYSVYNSLRKGVFLIGMIQSFQKK